ncbi:CobD/CbiB family cobalamin biosynthesis protein [Corynebacterium sp.]|uniref:CobD/CbiB family cobalamin biosynthesis protein n=1 Tax=Corynebacterium sp. TaxID=1720 RepID=UPI0026DB01DC|nr:CobD/CbiB family cobalamin biosynthesis protein [Corynebacterium sp.]MDO4609038.1 CobD/CbiB family cobalamin biosynthesis protein [Corynebacterium sp.]
MTGSRRSPARPNAAARRMAGLLAGFAADRAFGDPPRAHPVAVFGTWATWLRRRMHRDSRAAGAAYVAAAVIPPVAASWWLSRRLPAVTLAAATWAALGGTTLARTGERMARRLDAVGEPGPGSTAGEEAPADAAVALDRARELVPWLCSRDPSALDAPGIARATVESLAENTSDAVTGTLFWGAMAGAPGVVMHRCINTLDAMVGYRTPEYRNFGWAAARLDDVVNWVPARLTGMATVAAGPDRPGAVRAWRHDAAKHPSPNAGVPESTAAGALGVTLGGATVYAGGMEERPRLGDGPAPGVPDVRRAVRLTRRVQDIAAVMTVAPVAAAALAGVLRRGRERRRAGRARRR